MADANYYIVYNTVTNLPKAKYYESINTIKLSQDEVLIPCGKTDDMNNFSWLATQINDPTREIRLAKDYKKTLVGVKRSEIEREGFAYIFPDGPGTIQTRDEVDFRNINGLVSMALILTGMGDTVTTIGFRDMDNVTHWITAPQIISMGVFINTKVSANYANAWRIKNEIDACATNEEIEAVNIHTGW